jgi:hypothetical protein
VRDDPIFSCLFLSSFINLAKVEQSVEDLKTEGRGSYYVLKT